MLTWSRNGEGLTGWGEAARLEVSGPDRFAEAARWWRELCAAAEVADAVGASGCGPVAFGSFTFYDRSPSEASVLLVPEVVLGLRADRAWLTTITPAGAAAGSPPPPPLPTPPPSPAAPTGTAAPTNTTNTVTWAEGRVTEQAYMAAVARGVERIRSGDAAKIVLARDLVATAEAPFDVRRVLARLAGRFPDCWTFSVDGLVGATPELLLRRSGDVVHSRVLAGTAWRDTATDDAAGAAEAVVEGLLHSAKDREEHGYAVRSVADALAPYCAELAVPEEPRALCLPNVVHLSTDLSGRLASPSSVLELVGAVHPSAAVCGTPTGSAERLIAELEGLDRERYSGPVGWVDASGDGEFGIALRCGRISGRTARLFAGCGIVADSRPERELAETAAKFAAMRGALEG
ncbi:isochorismate synthase [Allostreptomyces psammosilenae]|uniref:isochorismate synthase n=1 Tax=Allostreptomyces psammosilenae TaxID=1892865 RepID=A0A852ZX33_9ACTN|nr:isochorismate synthase [Allostreptomyces psammosilenae]NYI05810.1 menaquinone-specific isochorismate synthase [Allostreptomyces psammosilenae]